MTPESLYGAWEYQAWQIRYEDGRCSSPFGPSASGLLLYTADGYMSATIMAAGRPLLSHANPRLASLEEKASAFDSYFTYAGRWYVEGDRVVHEVTLALNAGLIGTPQWREAHLQGNRLVLSVKEKTKTGERQHSLSWVRGWEGQ